MIYKNCKELYNKPEMYNKVFIGCSESEFDFYKNYIKKAKDILYLGSGSGRLLKKFVKINKNIVGVEISKNMIRFSKKLTPNTKIIQTNVLNLKLKQKSDLIIAPYRFLCHFNEKNLNKLFKIINHHLKPNELFVGDIFSPYIPHDRTIKRELAGIEKKVFL